MRKKLGVAAVALVAMLSVAVAVAWAGSPHFVGSPTVTVNSDNSLMVSGKEAGLGDESQVHITVTAVAGCINGGSKHPKAANKASTTASFNEPVQNGKANYTLGPISQPTNFQPSCDPPMTVQWLQVTVSDDTNGISATYNGPF